EPKFQFAAASPLLIQCEGPMWILTRNLNSSFSPTLLIHHVRSIMDTYQKPKFQFAAHHYSSVWSDVDTYQEPKFQFATAAPLLIQCESR
ncbi:hypothetical protein J6590_056194, partial [Homalodisca vitripennis]